MSLQSERDRGAHLLRRFGLGASEAELDYYLKDGYNGAVDLLLDYKSVDEGFNITIDNLDAKKNAVPMPLAVSWWTARLMATQRPLQEKMTLFWHDHFATSASKVKGAPLMVTQNETLRANATGNFRSMLKAIIQDPAMLFWLDAQENVKGHAQENLGREIMELFTLGIGNYTEKDVQEVARAFTGLSFRRGGANGPQFFFRPGAHDAGEKQILGKSANFNPEQVADLLCDHPQTATYLTTKLLSWFVMPNPDAATVKKFARIFRESDLDIGVLIRAMMKSSEFSSPAAHRSIVKTPVDFVVATSRQIGVGARVAQNVAGIETVPRGALGPAAAASSVMKSMGMYLFFPPDVAGWDQQQAWITSATMVERIAWADKIYMPPNAGRARNSLRWPAMPLLAGCRTPDQVVSKFESLYDSKLAPAIRPKVVDATEKAMGTGLAQANAQNVATLVSRLIFATPEFQFS